MKTFKKTKRLGCNGTSRAPIALYKTAEDWFCTSRFFPVFLFTLFTMVGLHFPTASPATGLQKNKPHPSQTESILEIKSLAHHQWNNKHTPLKPHTPWP